MTIQRLALLTALPLQVIASISHAGVLPPSVVSTITLAPTPLPAPPAAPDAGAMAPAVPVPVMDSVMLLAVGLLLMVVAIRFLRHSKASQKIMSIALLGAGLVLGGAGAERTVAALYADFPIAPNCEGVDIVLNGLEPSQVVNDCDTAQDIDTIATDITPGGDLCYVVVLAPENEGTCMSGLTLEPGASCTADLYTEEATSVPGLDCGEVPY
ncbi:hypothetical protein EY643_03885 [Halioglobus maricola]|uniref:Midcut-by-XrtH protein n=1 Tax=Halioglobus maricola TaxID=2601894 RepID=A0A5P9NGE8_9GAMM|nr:hypothetical protein [Halioglobus maricola]QFU74852.1 hypothetical protein EY643_03885 [Halioglobus maricola]